MIYKGYIPTKDKAPLTKYKDRKNLLSLDEVKDLPEYAGVLADDVILVDIDDKEQSEILMQIVEDKQLDCVVRQTSRGKHFLFKNTIIDKCKTGKKLACGLEADIKIGKHNGTQILKFNGEERFVEWDTEGRELQEIPKWLFPVNSTVDFFNMEEGDGRNSTLFSYILTLTSAGFSKEEARECIEIINKYVLREPLSEDELEIILRDEAFPADTFFEGKKFLHNNFAEFLKNNDHIKRIYGQLHVFRDGVYVAGSREIQRAMIKHIPIMKDTQRSEVLKYLDLICEPTDPDNNANLIAFGNGLFNIVSGELREYSPEIVITNKIPWAYDPEAYSELADITLNKIACGNHEIRMLLEECIGYCFYRRNELSKSFMLTGGGSNGKSVFLDMVKNVLGEGNYSALDLNELDERFSVATMAGKLANIGDDISDEFLQGRAIANFKKLVSGNQVKAEIKNDPNIFFMKPTVKLLFSANDIPVMKDKTGAVLRRMIIVPFNAKFSKNDPDYDPYITWKLKDEQVMKYLIRIGIEGLRRILENNGFTESKEVQDELNEFELRNNPILSFINDISIESILNQPTKEVFRMYKVYCVEKGFMEMTQPNFSRELNRRLNLTVKRVRINGELTGIYVRK